MYSTSNPKSLWCIEETKKSIDMKLFSLIPMRLQYCIQWENFIIVQMEIKSNQYVQNVVKQQERNKTICSFFAQIFPTRCMKNQKNSNFRNEDSSRRLR